MLETHMTIVGRRHLAACLITLAFALAGWHDACAGDETNLALGKTYELMPPPGYKRCTDPGDRVQLTDGSKRGCDWRETSTVGWSDAGRPPTVLIDLGSVQPIGEIRVHSVGGGFAGVFYPAQILAMVSDDGRRFHVADALHHPKREPPGFFSSRGRPHTFRLEGLKSRGRYVLVTLVPTKRYVFVDEIEVLRGLYNTADVRLADADTYARDDVAEVFATLRRAERVHSEVDRLTEAMAAKGADPSLHEAVETLQQLVRTTPQYSAAHVGQLAERLRSTRGQWLAAKHGKPLVWRQANPMEQLRRDDVFDLGSPALDELAIELWQGEYESAALTVVNASPQDIVVDVAVSPLASPSGQSLPSADTFTLRRAVFVETLGAGVIGDALVRLSNRSLPIEAGSAGQLWLTAHNPDLPPGEYRFVIRLADIAAKGTGQRAVSVPGRITVHPCQFPKRASLKTYTWAYLSRLDLDAPAARWVVRDLEDHYLNVHILPGMDCPKAGLKADGTLKIDFRRHDAQLSLFPDADQYLFFWGYKPDRLDGHGKWGSWMSPGFKTAMRQYLTEWVAHLHNAGIGYDRFAMYPFDESLCEEYVQLARFIREVDPNIRLFANSAGGRKGDRFTPMLGHVDIWCLPERAERSTVARATLKRQGNKQVWRYFAATDAKTMSPHDRYRLLPWRAWSDGDTGCGFWQYAAGRGEGRCAGWDDFTCGLGRWSVVYDGRGAPVDTAGERFVPSRRWEAWREGIEDYEYLRTLRARIEACCSRGLDDSVLREAQAALTGAVKSVLGKTGDRGATYAARRRITEAILRLDKAAGTLP